MSWITDIEADLGKEFGSGPKIVTLATMAGDQPDARSIVVREFFSDGAILFTSDSRSQKNAQLRMNPNAVIVAWLPKLKRQYRLTGRVEIIESAHTLRQKHWEKFSDSSRAMFFWPRPGSDFDTSTDMPLKTSAAAAMPDSFSVLILRPQQVDTLDLNPQPHSRVRWILQDGNWSSTRINP